jgi:protein O-GlcNAc transferase
MAAPNFSKSIQTCLTDGVDCINKGSAPMATDALQHKLSFNPLDALAHYNRGIACHMAESYDQAIANYQKAIVLAPSFQQAHHNLAQSYAKCRQYTSAIAAYQRALALDPEDAKSAYNMGLLYEKIGNPKKMITAYRQALSAMPDFAKVFSALGMFYCQQDRLEEAMLCLGQALSINPDLAEAHLNMGIVLQKKGHYRKGLTHYQHALSCKPNFSKAKWLCMLSLPMLYRNEESIGSYRRQFAGNLNKLIASTPLDSVQNRRNALLGVGTTTNFYLQYQCRNDLQLQVQYGKFAHEIMAANFPHWTRKKKMPPLNAGDKIRIGYVSSYMYHHTVGTFLLGWLESHTHSNFDIHCYHLGNKVDALTLRLRSLSQHFHHFIGDMATAADRIDSDDLHILVYADIGMNPITTQLAALRLAPIQCKGWGHPVTTGLPTIDYYLSSDLMEPANAESHYSEFLVRLPNLALYYNPPALPAKPKTRVELGIPIDRFVYLSTQSIFKYLPQHDDIYPRIAKSVPRACFAFIAHPSLKATAKFKARLNSAFEALDLDAGQFCHFIPKLNFNDFLSLNMVSDVLLDSFGWSGGKTCLEAISCGLPIVTCPGRFMRGRHAFAMLTMMGIDTTIARDKTGYCRIAVRLAIDPNFYTFTKGEFLSRRGKLYNDKEFIKGLENFYRQAPEAICKLWK